MGLQKIGFSLTGDNAVYVLICTPCLIQMSLMCIRQSWTTTCCFAKEKRHLIDVIGWRWIDVLPAIPGEQSL